MEPSELEVLPAKMAGGAARVFARRHLLKYKHPAIDEPNDFVTSLASAFGPAAAEDPGTYVFWHRPTGTHFTVYAHKTWAAYGGGLKFPEPPDLATLEAAYEIENARRAAIGTPGPDPLLVDLLGSASSFNEHMREVERAQLASPRGFFDFLTRFEELLERFPPADRRAVIATGLDGPTIGPVSLTAKGIENGKYFERQVTIEEAYEVIIAKLADRPELIAKVLFDWWAQHAKLSKPAEPVAALLLESWRARFDAAMSEALPPADGAAYQENARARHEDHERAQRWMRFARLGLLLPLTLADADKLAASAKGVATQSTEHKKLDKLRRTLRG